jgi:hypothetical protein
MSDFFSDDDVGEGDSTHAPIKQRRFATRHKPAKRQKQAIANVNETSGDRSAVVATSDVLSFQTLLAQREAVPWTEERLVDRVVAELTAIRDIKSLYESIGRGADYRLDRQNDDGSSDHDRDKKLADTDTDVWIV